MPRPSSPVCAKASTKCPYLTLESPHHQRQHWIGPKTDTKLGRAVCRSILVWMFISQPCLEAPHLSGQPDGTCCFRFVPALASSTVRRPPLKPTPSRHRFEKPIHNVKKLAVSDCNTAPRSRSRYFIIRISGARPLPFKKWWSLSGSNR